MIPYQAIECPLFIFDPESAGERCPHGMAGLFEDKHGKSGDEIIEEPVPYGIADWHPAHGIIPLSTSGRDDPAKPGEGLGICYRFSHGLKPSGTVHGHEPVISAKDLIDEVGAELIAV